MAEIRRCRPGDRADLYRVCLATGDSGGDASALCRDPDLLGHLYVGPYLELEQSLAIALVDGEGVAGYVLGALDTRDFEARAERLWWPALRRRYPEPDPAVRPTWTRDDRLAHLIHRPPRAAPEITATHPSHLHIDLLPRCQGAGHGRRMMATLCDALRERGSPGVHLGVGRRNERAIAFYHRVGFTELRASPDALTLGQLL
ncbi:MAG: GNAT family N-acetyltransferase [Micromonosporaceae bacterium]|nr:GNAT family N-acetyltransferase [Micromonosporaceae bacterium]